MTLLPPPSSLPPAFAAFTQNSEASGGVVGAFDLLCLSGVIISVLQNDSHTTSTGAGLLATHLDVEDTTGMTEPGSMSTTDSSALMVATMPNDGQSAHAGHGQFKFSFDEAGCFGTASLLQALLLKNVVQCATPNQT